MRSAERRSAPFGAVLRYFVYSFKAVAARRHHARVNLFYSVRHFIRLYLPFNNYKYTIIYIQSQLQKLQKNVYKLHKLRYNRLNLKIFEVTHMKHNVLAYDFGASSGRAMLGTLEDGRIEIKEIHRFPTTP